MVSTLWKILVSWGYYSQDMGKIKMVQTTNQKKQKQKKTCVCCFDWSESKRSHQRDITQQNDFFQRTAHSLGRSARSTLWYSKRGLMENHPLFIDEIHSYIYIDSYINLKSIKNRKVYFVGSCIGVQLVVPFLPSSKKSSTPAKKEEPPHQGMRQTSSINHQQHPSIGKSQRLPSGNLTGCLWKIYHGS